MFHKINQFFLKNKFAVSVFFILLIALIFRFYNYPFRFALGPDQAGFAIQSKFALESFSLPLLGPFSSGAPFQTGGEWYWFIMLGYLIFPFTNIAPWIFLTLSSVVFILILILYAKKIEDKKFALIVGLLAAISPAQITQSVNLTNQSPQALFSVLALYSSHLLLKTNKSIYSFFIGLFIGISSAIHLQGGALVTIFLITVIVGRIKSLKIYLTFLLGAFLAWLPVLIKDIDNNFYNSKNMINYYLFNENAISYEALGRRWLTFVGEFVPNSWALVSGGFSFISIFIISSSILIFLFLLFNRKLKKDWIIIFCVYLISIFILRYTRTPIFESYIVFLHPFIYLITGFVIYYFYKYKKLLGIFILAIIIISTLQKTEAEIKATTHDKFNFEIYSIKLEKGYPEKKYAIYDYKFSNKLFAIPFVFHLYSDKKLNDDGVPIGINIATTSASFNSKYKPILKAKPGGFELYDLSDYTKEELKDLGWDGINPSMLYDATQNWYKDN